MADFGFVRTAADMVMSGIDTWMISNVAANNGFVSLGLLKDAKLDIEGMAETDTRQRDHVFGEKVTITAKMLYTNKATCLELLSAVAASGPMYQKLAFINGGTLCGLWGFKWNFVSDKEIDGVRYIEVTADIGQPLSAHAALFATPGVDGTPSGTLATFAPTTMYAGGVTSIYIKKAAETAEDIGITRNVVFKIGSKMLKPDSLGRSYCVGVEYSLEFDLLEASSVNALLLDDISAAGALDGFVVTLSDGTIFTLTGATTGSGCKWTFKHDNDSEDVAVIHIVGKGVLTLAEYDTAIS
jgi:hypothetical protein